MKLKNFKLHLGLSMTSVMTFLVIIIKFDILKLYVCKGFVK
jgi:hypothetical protein